jgi:hypothetical protein
MYKIRSVIVCRGQICYFLFIAGKGYHKLREGTHQKVMEFASKLFDMIRMMVGSRTAAFSEFSKSKQSISSDIGSDIEETETLTPT